MSDALVFTGTREGGLEFIWENGVYVRDRYVGLIYPLVRSKLVFGLPNDFNKKGQCPKASHELGGARSAGLPQKIWHMKSVRKIGNWVHFRLVRKRWEASGAYQKKNLLPCLSLFYSSEDDALLCSLNLSSPDLP
jgi:hypothetical protein